MPLPTRLAILCSYSGEGGVERVVNLLSGELARHVSVDLLTLKFRGPHIEAVPPNVNLIRLRSSHAAAADREIAEYLRRARPDLLLAAKDRAGRAALRAQALSAVDVPVWLQLHTTLSASLERRSALTRWWRLRPMRSDYPRADGIVCVSRGVADDLIDVLGLPAGRVHVVRNPVVSSTTLALSAESVNHPWLGPERTAPVVMGMGRLTAQKDFSTLLRAFALLRARRPIRLLVLGEGDQREELTRLSRVLDVEVDVQFPGFQSNPYAWLAKADLFVLSSRWEGSPMTLAEALSMGVPSVSTDCPSGPRETLQGGRYGPLVPVGDVAALAEAMQATLDRPLPSKLLREAAESFRVETVAQRYLEVLFARSALPARKPERVS